MMNDQEMQFADPEWRPRQGQNGSYAEAEFYHPRPINDDRPQPEQQQWAETPERVYKAQELPPYQTPSYQVPPVMSGPYQYRYGQVKTRRRRSPWIWLIAALIVLSMLGGMIGRFGSRSSSGFMSMKDGFPAHQAPFAQTQPFKVSPQSAPTIIINNSGGSGDIQVQGGGDPNLVTVQSDGQSPGVAQTSPDTLSVNMTDSNITLTVPDNANLVITSDNGDMTVNSVSGQMTLTSGSGSITMQDVTLTGNSTIKSGAGDISFQGQLDPSGSYQFISTDSGSVDLTLPSNSAFSLNATAPNGSIDPSGFSQVQVQPTGSGATAHGDVGNAPRATLTITTGSGDISLSAQ